MLSTVTDVKSIKSHYGILELIEKSYNLDYSDTRLKSIENILVSLTKSEPLEDSTHVKEAETSNIVDAINNFKY